MSPLTVTMMIELEERSRFVTLAILITSEVYPIVTVQVGLFTDCFKVAYPFAPDAINPGWGAGQRLLPNTLVGRGRLLEVPLRHLDEDEVGDGEDEVPDDTPAGDLVGRVDLEGRGIGHGWFPSTGRPTLRPRVVCCHGTALSRDGGREAAMMA